MGGSNRPDLKGEFRYSLISRVVGMAAARTPQLVWPTGQFFIMFTFDSASIS